jgi:signal peptidase
MKNKSALYSSALLLLIYIIMLKTVFLEYLVSYVNIFNILFLFILVIICYKILGIPKKKLLINENAIQKIIIYFIIYYFLIYVFGLFFGFLKNGYSLKLLNILGNVLSAFILYILLELYRYMIACKTSKKNFIPLVIVTILIAVLNVIMEINAYNLDSGTGIVEFIEGSLVPALALSSLLSYISYKFDYKLAVIFLVIYDLPKYFLPIIPDMGVYIKSMVSLIFIFICYYGLSVIMEKYERQIAINKIQKKKHLLFLIVIPLIVLIGLVSGLFKYHLFAIGSNSMVPTFTRGDAVLIEKLNTSEYKKIKKGDILAFKYNNQILVHRVISVKEKNGLYFINTKGDNNDSPDGWTVTNDDIYGVVIHVVKYVGMPSVELSELISKRGD